MKYIRMLLTAIGIFAMVAIAQAAGGPAGTDKAAKRTPSDAIQLALHGGSHARRANRHNARQGRRANRRDAHQDRRANRRDARQDRRANRRDARQERRARRRENHQERRLENLDQSNAKININQADAKNLTQIKGIGKKRAKAIVAYRKQNGPINSIDELANIRGIGPSFVNNHRPELEQALRFS